MPEAIKAGGKGTEGQVARAYGVHSVTVVRLKRRFLKRGAYVFRDGERVKAQERRIAKPERMLGQKEAEISLLKNFCGG